MGSRRRKLVLEEGRGFLRPPGAGREGAFGLRQELQD